MAKGKFLKDSSGNKIYPVSHTRVVYDDNGNTLNTALANKVDKIAGKGLSTNDYTTAEKNKLSGIDYATDSEIQSVWDTGGGNNE